MTSRDPAPSWRSPTCDCLDRPNPDRSPDRKNGTLRCSRQQHELVECAVYGAMFEDMTKHQRWHEDFTPLVRPG